MPIERHVDGGEATIDLSLGLGERHLVEQGMREGVVGDGVALGEFAAGELGMRLHVAAEQEERRLHAFVP